MTNDFKPKLPHGFTTVDVYSFIQTLAQVAHHGQKYGSRQYIYHLEEVERTYIRNIDLKELSKIKDHLGIEEYSISEISYLIQAACWGHDLIEDTWVTEDFLRMKKLPEIFIQMIVSVTKLKDETQQEYLMKVCRNPLAVILKTADSLSNLEHSIRSRWQKGVTKYTNVLRFLKGDGTIHPYTLINNKEVTEMDENTYIFKTELTPSSKNVKKVGYDSTKEALLIEFSYGGEYIYKGVDKLMYTSLMNSQSIGSFISKQIKGVYKFEKVGKQHEVTYEG